MVALFSNLIAVLKKLPLVRVLIMVLFLFIEYHISNMRMPYNFITSAATVIDSNDNNIQIKRFNDNFTLAVNYNGDINSTLKINAQPNAKYTELELDDKIEKAFKQTVDNLHIPKDVSMTVFEKPVQNVSQQLPQPLTMEKCGVLKRQKRNSRPPIYVITPTYQRLEQIAELTRLSQTLMNVDNLHWLVVEDAVNKSETVSNFLNDLIFTSYHLVAPMPEEYKSKAGDKPRGVSNRNEGIKWVRKNAINGVMYFADDDNTYDLQVFEEMRYTKKVSMWPVGLTYSGLSTPVVKNGKLVGFYEGWIGGRKFAVDNAGFAVSVKFLLRRPMASIPFDAGYEEDGFLTSLQPFEPSEIEIKADNCTKILVWHTQTVKNVPASMIDKNKYDNTNIIELGKFLVFS